MSQQAPPGSAGGLPSNQSTTMSANGLTTAAQSAAARAQYAQSQAIAGALSANPGADVAGLLQLMTNSNPYAALTTQAQQAMYNPNLLTSQHPMFHEIQARAAAQAADNPVLFSRVEGGAGEMNEEIGKIAQEGVEETVSNEVFAVYQNKEVVPGCRPHPGDIVEAGSLSALKLPDPEYPLAESLPSEIVTGGKLSSLQLEGVIHACQRHQMILPNGNRAGFFIGDAAGVGKGRQISGTILDNFCRGRTKHIWFSISTDLIVDARRDLSDLGCHIKVIEGCQQLDKETKVFGLPADLKDGVVFSTYATLVSSVQKGGAFSNSRHTRIQQLVDWCGGTEFDGCLIFDECHKAKNFVPGKEQASTKVAMAVTSLQRMLPKSRVLYCSATGVSDVKNMAFMERMGLWGDGAAFKSFEQFIETVQKKGLGVAEMLAMEMKTSGMYVARSLSFKQAEFTTEEIKLTKDQVKMYNTAAHVWTELKKSLEAAVDRTGCSNKRLWASYWASHQRFFKQLCMGIKVPSIVEEAKKALESGYCVVIGLQTTGEASLDSEINKSGTQLKDFVSLCREIFSRFVEQHFPTAMEGKLTPHGSPIFDEWSCTAKKMLQDFINQITLPPSTLDEIIHLLGGPDCVAEMTGRRGRVVKPADGEPPRYEIRDSDSGNLDSLNVRERNAFMQGNKHVAIISDAASTGISLHASLSAGNQRRRVHLTIELPWSADKAVQQLGRSHRSNQSSGPLYKLMTTNLGGERRFAAAVAKRLQSLGALTKGDRRAATGADLAEFNFDTPYGRTALRAMYTGICQKHLAPGVTLTRVTLDKYDFSRFNSEMTECLSMMGILEPDTLTSGLKVKDGMSGDVGKFLNRILGVSVGRQNLIFNYFTQCLDAQIAMAKREGRYNEGLVDITASSVQLVREPKEVFKARNTTNNPTKHHILSVDRGMSWECAVSRYEAHSGATYSEDNTFYVSRRDVRRQRFYILATLREGSQHMFKIARPNTGVSAFEETKDDLLSKYSPISQEKAEPHWKQQYSDSNTQCIHGPHCKNGSSCSVGTRCYKMHLLCGGIVTMMSLLELTIARYGPRLQLTKSESTLRVVRAKLDSGERIVGIRYPEVLIPLVEKSILEEDQYREAINRSQQTGMNNGLPLTQPSSNETESSEATARKSAQIEPISVVVPRLVTKAMTPPLTIRSFFKPKESTASTPSEGVSSSSTNSPKKTPSILSSKSSSTVSGGPSKGVKRTFSQTSSSSSSKNSSKKRPCITPAKKQGSIFASFAKKQSNTTSNSATKCPVCGHEFEKGTTNTDINKHVDNCLIE